MHKLYEWACNELEELESKAEKGLSAADVEYADRLTELKKNILKIEMLEDEGYSAEYRDDMGSYARGNRGNYNRGYYRGGSYARGRNARRDSMGRYSRDGYSRAADEQIEMLESMMESAPNEQIKKEIEKLITKIENA
jgi:hypothetical protein